MKRGETLLGWPRFAPGLRRLRDATDPLLRQARLRDVSGVT